MRNSHVKHVLNDHTISYNQIYYSVLLIFVVSKLMEKLYFILGRAEWRWNFSSILKDGSYIHRFQKVHMVETHFLLENLWISEPSLGILEKFQHSSALPNIEYNCALLFWS